MPGNPIADDLLRQFLEAGGAKASDPLSELVPGGEEEPAGYGAVEPGNIDLTRRPHVKNPDGSISTVRSMGVNLDGKEYLIPTVSDDGRIMSDDEAVDEFKRTGKHLGVYASPEASTAAAERIHKDQETKLPQNTLAGKPPVVRETSQAIKAAQENTAPVQHSSLAMAQNDPDKFVLEGSIKQRSPSKEIVDTEQARRDAHNEKIRKFLAERSEPSGGGDIIGPNERKYYETVGRPRGRGMAGLTKEGAALWSQNYARWQDGLEKARAADHEHSSLNRPISNALVGFIARTNPDIPLEAVSKLREGDPLVKLLGQGGLGVDFRERKMDRGTFETEIKTDSAENIALEKNAADFQRAMLEASAEAVKRKGGTGSGTVMLSRRASNLLNDMRALELQLSPEQAVDLITGELKPADMPDLSEGMIALLEGAIFSHRTMEADQVNKYQPKTTSREPGLAAQVTASLYRKSHDPATQHKIKGQLDSQGAAVKAALAAWHRLKSKPAAALLTQVGTDGWLAELKKKGFSPQDQSDASAIYAMINQHIKNISGAAVTGAEWKRLASEIGLSDVVSPFNSPGVLGDWLQRAGQVHARSLSNARQFYPDMFPVAGATQ